jgi:predicted small metal-binding protein
MEAGQGKNDEVETMKLFACGDVVPGCDARFVCSSSDEILVQVASHARLVHGMADLPMPVQARVRELIRAS